MNAFAAGLVPLAIAIDEAFGEPPSALHPVVWMGRVIAAAERAAPARGRAAPFFAGSAIAIAVPAAFAWTAHLVELRLQTAGAVGLIADALLVKATLSLRALGRAAQTVRDAVASGRIPDARRALRSLCSRDPSALEGPELLAATIESLAENASDSVVAPLFWLALLGLPGAMFYRAVNTLDAMIGYRGRYEWLGKASARLDDAMNWIPARLTALLLLGAAAALGLDARRGALILRRDGAKTESPNAGRPMAAMAGVLGVTLAKAGHYTLGDARQPITPIHADQAWRVVHVAALLAAAAASAAMLVRAG